MRTGGWRPFWTALWAGLLVLLPLMGGTQIGRASCRERVF